MTEEIRQLKFVAPPRACRVLLLRHGETTPVSDGVAAVAAAYPDRIVVVVSHGGTIGQALAEASGSRPLAFAPDNCSISEIVVTTEGWVLRRFNDVAHLDGR